jgi:4-amino-4-deoxy-L-arabinose transferase-like glycosyltransferase
MSRTRLFLSLLTAASLLLAWLILSDSLPYLRGPAPGTSEWYWPYLLRPVERWWAPVGAALLLFLVAGWWLSRPTGRRGTTAVALSLLVGGNLLLQMALIYADRPAFMAELVDRTLSNLSGGYFQAAAESEAIGDLLRRYPAAMPDFASDHLRTHPPGLLLLNWSTVRLSALFRDTAVNDALGRQVIPWRCADLWLLKRPLYVSSALLALSLLPLLAAAGTALPAYALARRLMAEDAARLATLLVATLPALLLFAPQSDQFFPAGALAVFYGLHRGMAAEARRWAQAGWWFAAGFVLSLLTFLSLGNAALLLPAGLWLLLWQWARHKQIEPEVHLPAAGKRRLFAGPYAALLWWAASFGAGVTAVWLIYWAGWGVPPWSVAQVGLEQHYELVNQYRRYSWWLFFNGVDLVMYAGLPLLAGFTASVVVAMQRLRRPERRPGALPLLALSLALFLVVLNVTGSTRAEVGRIWLFFMPLLALVSGGYLAATLPRWRQAWLVVGLQLVLLLAVGLAWRPVRAVIVVPQKPALAHDVTATIPLVASFEPGILLTGYDLDDSQARPGGTLHLTLHWQSTGLVTRPYTVFTHLIDAQGLLVAQQDNWPMQGQWPPTCWQRGEVVVDPYAILLPAEMAAGDYTLYAGLYDAQDGTRLTSNGRDVVTLRTISINTWK